jgi:hypothetical protein
VNGLGRGVKICIYLIKIGGGHGLHGSPLVKYGRGRESSPRYAYFSLFAFSYCQKAATLNQSFMVGQWAHVGTEIIGVQRGLSEGVEDGHMPPALRAHPQGAERSGMAGPSDTLGSP